MITMKPASELVRGDVFSTDGYEVVGVGILADGRVDLDIAKGDHHKRALVDGTHPCPIWTPDA
jgi:hypothetical protein